MVRDFFASKDSLAHSSISDSVHQIFEPVINEIEKLVAEQANKVRVKRLTDNHPKGPDIKVRLVTCLTVFESSSFFRPFSWWEDLEPVNTLKPDFKRLIPGFRSFSLLMRKHGSPQLLIHNHNHKVY